MRTLRAWENHPSYLLLYKNIPLKAMDKLDNLFFYLYNNLHKLSPREHFYFGLTLALFQRASHAVDMQGELNGEPIFRFI